MKKIDIFLFTAVLGLIIIPTLVLGNSFLESFRDKNQLERESLDLKRKNQLLSQNEECYKYKDQIIKSAVESRGIHYTLDSIFYSPIKHSCLYAVMYDNYESATSDQGVDLFFTFEIIDFFTGKEVYYDYYSSQKESLDEAESSFQEAVNYFSN